MTTLVRRENRLSPWREFDRAFNELTKMMLRDLASWLSTWEDGECSTQRTWITSTDIFRKGENLVIRMDVPGISPESIEVTVDNDGFLTIKGERKWEESEVDVLCCERYYGSFERSIQLPEGVDTEHIEASYKDGVLELRIPYREAPKPSQRRIEVKVG
ncbi:MAG: Hsp20/alpha crystallin family protein [Armatimonadetes bacterium]|nr:Hsp20/alpha crystallin family protein [Armatimonadota bacterium]